METKKYKIIVIGNGAVGKTTLITKFTNYYNSFDPTIPDVYFKKLNINGIQYEIEIIEMYDCFVYENCKKDFDKFGDGFIIIYSICSQATFNDLDGYYNDIVNSRKTKDVPIILIGSKKDLENERIVEEKYGKEFAEERTIDFMEINAKNEEDVNAVFYSLIKKIDEKYSTQSSYCCLL